MRVEFYNKTFMNFLKNNSITLYSTFNEGKAIVVERFNRTMLFGGIFITWLLHSELLQ